MEGMNAVLKVKVRIRQSETGSPPPPERPTAIVVASLVLAAALLFMYTVIK